MFLGDNVKIQNYVSVYHGVTIEDGVFVGPHVCFTNDLKPRAINSDGSLKAADDWVLSLTRIRRGAALGANSTIRCGITVGAWAMIGSGSVVTKDIPDYGLAMGNPARLHGLCPCGESSKRNDSPGHVVAACPKSAKLLKYRRKIGSKSNDQYCETKLAKKKAVLEVLDSGIAQGPRCL
jgi:acyl-[acyl carrier protein]--UDP-N-acetylglucosamine O-acyltransferase